ncbi:hypothetical protein Tsubulata_018690 [Turnera subulata]|uniref:Uncharacterized protein n=1 Tax=Turnera subulata TaxID=218843 RepID=A0A9Q0G0L4_9ROSI|nr:hypothetical protein Tsubulata_018690 [Turnera subulata]
MPQKTGENDPREKEKKPKLWDSTENKATNNSINRSYRSPLSPSICNCKCWLSSCYEADSNGES